MADEPQAVDRRALLHEALQAIDDLRERLDRTEHAAREPIAIVGMGCRFPGGITTPDEYWQFLRDGRDAITEYPAERREMLAASGVDFDAADPEHPWFGGFLDDVDRFDPGFFGISPREAVSMDPQQRLVLEVAWEALERAGVAPDSLAGSATGVYLGITSSDYVQLAKLAGAAQLDVYTATGGALNAAAGRVAYTLGLQGPCMSIDTACSSSMVAIHQACQSLRLGESDLALAGGVNVVLMPEAFVCFERWGMMASDGRCKTFDAAADGFVRAEGCGMLVLRRLSDAVANGDPILAVIRGSAVNQDGRSSGLTVPNGPAQQAVVRRALDNAGVAPADIQYVEAHGTGTTLGDPIEVEAIGAVLGQGRGDDRPLFLGSVKTNLGHMESAAGVAGVMKVVLAMQHGEVPPHLHFHERAPQIPWPAFPVLIPTERTPWPATDGVRLAGVSGFGFSGTNAHVVLESAPAAEPPAADTDDRPRVFAISARSEESLAALAGRVADHLDSHPEVALADVTTTATIGRARFEHRIAVVEREPAGLAAQLHGFAAGDDTRVATGSGPRPRVAFLCSGQGSQFVGMAAGLYGVEPVFRGAFDRVVGLLDPLVGVSLGEVVFGGVGGVLSETWLAQPALFAVEWALGELWRSWGVVPDVVLGHSLGELVGAVLAGVVGLEDGCRLVAARGRLMGGLPSGGVMFAVSAGVERVSGVVDGVGGGGVVVAAVNGPLDTVVSGEAGAVGRVVDVLVGEGVGVRQLVVSHAFHSPLMDPVLGAFGEVVGSVGLGVPRVRLVSNVTGGVVGEEVCDPGYWVRQVREPVLFGAGVECLVGLGVSVFVELGPHPVLLGLARGSVDGGVWVPSLRRGRDDREQMLEGVASLYAAGVPIDWKAVQPAGRRIDLPTSPFQRDRHWVSSRPARRQRTGDHPLLGRRTRSPLVDSVVFEQQLGPDATAWLGDHRLYGDVVLPGTAYAAMVLAAAGGEGPVAVEELTLQEPLVLDDDRDVTVQTVVSRHDGTVAVDVLSFDETDPDAWTQHATARVVDEPAREPIEPVEPDTVLATYPDEVDVDAYYAALGSIGLDYGPSFRALERLRRRDGGAVGAVRLHELAAADAAAYALHPALLDACFHVVGAALTDAAPGESDSILVPFAISGLRVVAPAPAFVWCAAELLTPSDAPAGSSVAVRLALFDDRGAPVAAIDRLDLRRAPRSAFRRHRRAADLLYELRWHPEPLAGELGEPVSVLVVGDAEPAAALAGALTAAGGGSCLTAAAGEVAELLDRTSFDAVVHLVTAPVTPPPGAEQLLDAIRPPVEEVLEVVRALARAEDSAARLYLVTRGGRSVDGEATCVAVAPLNGLARSITTELPQLRCTTIDLDLLGDPGEQAAVAAELVARSDEDHVAVRGGARFVARLAPAAPHLPVAGDRPYQLALAARGSLDEIAFTPLERQAPGAGEVEVEVLATGLNFRDVLNVLGMYPGDPGAPGLECAGVVVAVGPGVADLAVGDHVLGIAPRAFDAYVITRAELLVRKPAAMSFAEAASVPIAYLTAQLGLHHLAGLRAGERVLVHAAAGGVGMAAVRLAHAAGAEVYATVGSAPKRAALEALGVRHIYSSRTTDFADQILADTDGAGVDVVLNSLSDEFIERSFSALRPDGRFLEIGKRGIWSAEQVRAARPAVAYHPYDLADFLDRPGVIHEALSSLVQAMDEDGALAPLPVRAFAVERAGDAFRHMAQARHIGKVVITHRPWQHRPAPADGWCVVTGGLGGLGLEAARALAEAGARRLLLVGRHDPTPPAQQVIDELNALGVTVTTVRADVGTADGVAAVLDHVDRSGVALRGIVHAAGVLDDGVLTEQTWSRVATVMRPKAGGAWLLHQATRGRPIEFFVAYSSASALLGSAGQANYAAANAFLDALAEDRAAHGLPALSIGWGAWSEVGMVAALDERGRARLEARGVGSIDPPTGRSVLRELMQQPRSRLAVLPIDWQLLVAEMPTATPPLLGDVAAGPSDARQAPSRRARQTVQMELAGVAPEEQYRVLQAFVAREVALVLALDPRQVLEPARGLSDVGMDSLMAVELANRLSAGVGRKLPSTLAFECPTLGELTAHLAELLDVHDPAAGAPASAEADALAELSDDAVTEMLLQELKDTGY